MKIGGPDTMEQWMRDISRRLSRLEQQPRGSGASLLGAVQPEEPVEPPESLVEPLDETP